MNAFNMTNKPTERNSEMHDTAKHGNDRTSTYLALILGGIALLFYVIAWLKFWQ